MVYITGDTHGDFSRFSARAFPAQRQMDRSDMVIVCGDFGGVWHDCPEERHRLDWLGEKPFTTCFVDGNHENFDRLESDEFPLVEFHGGSARRIRDGVYYLRRGYVFDFEGRSFFCMGGAASHDMRDGLLDPADYSDRGAFRRAYRSWPRLGRQFASTTSRGGSGSCRTGTRWSLPRGCCGSTAFKWTMS